MDIQIKLNKLQADFLSRFLCDSLEKLQNKTDIQSPDKYTHKLFIDAAFNFILQTGEQLTNEDYKNIDTQNKINAANFLKAENVSDK